MADGISAVLVVLITILVPPIGVFLVSGCGADFCINICLTLLGYIPGHIHAFYVEYVYFDRRERARYGELTGHEDAPGVYSQSVQRGANGEQGQGQGYGTV